MAEPLVSVVMPAFNAENYIIEAVDSVLTQDYTNWELFVVNDGSTDSTAEILNSYTDPRIKVVHQVNQGVSIARNQGLARMKGHFFTFLDADDLWPLNSLSSRIRFMQKNPRVDWLSGAVRMFCNQPGDYYQTWTPCFRGDPLIGLVRLDARVFSHVGYLVRRQVSANYSFSPGMTHGEDLLFFLELAASRPTLLDYIDTPVLYYRRGHGSAMSNLDSLESGYWTLYDRVSNLNNPKIKCGDRVYLKTRICRIMFLSYLRQWSLKKALRVLTKLLRPIRPD